mgnify:CR=1 FL=1
MNVTSLIVGLLLSFLIIGAIVGGLAGPLMHGGGFSRLGNVGVGIVGAFSGGFLFSLAPFSVEVGLIGCPLAAAVGAVVLLWLVGCLKKA